MTTEDWAELERLGGLANSHLSVIWRDNYLSLLHKTENEEEHPDDHQGPCLCETCKSYSD